MGAGWHKEFTSDVQKKRWAANAGTEKYRSTRTRRKRYKEESPQKKKTNPCSGKKGLERSSEGVLRKGKTTPGEIGKKQVCRPKHPATGGGGRVRSNRKKRRTGKNTKTEKKKQASSGLRRKRKKPIKLDIAPVVKKSCVCNAKQPPPKKGKTKKGNLAPLQRMGGG